jgi:hypothetical protein
MSLLRAVGKAMMRSLTLIKSEGLGMDERVVPHMIVRELRVLRAAKARMSSTAAVRAPAPVSTGFAREVLLFAIPGKTCQVR